jgi:uncharacterized protein DUF3592
LLGTAGLLYGLVEFRRARESEHWLVEDATVLDASVSTHRGGMTGSSYSPLIRYEYTRNDVTYEGSRIMFSGLDFTSSRKNVEDFVMPFVKGSTIRIRVSPRDPRLSVIEAGVDQRLKLMLFVASYIMLMGLGGLLGWWK